MRCEIVSTDGMRSSEFTCPVCDAHVCAGATPQYLTGTKFPCTSCFQPLQCFEYTPVYIIVAVPTKPDETPQRVAPAFDDRVYFDDPVIEPDLLSLHDAVSAIRETGKLNCFDRAGYVLALRQMAEAFGDPEWEYNADILENMPVKDWLFCIANDSWDDYYEVC